MRILRVFGTLMLGLLMLGPMTQSARGDDLPDIIGKIKPGIVGIGTFHAIRQPQIVMMGTGFVVGDGRQVITNNHVVDDFDKLADKEYPVVLAGQGTGYDVFPAEIEDSDEVHDLALLTFSGGQAQALVLSDDDQLIPEGTAIAATGFPLGPVLGLYPVTHTGIISSVAPNLIPQTDAGKLNPAFIAASRFDVYLLDITSYPGNSGSPVYRVDTGEVVAVVNKVFVQGTRENAVRTPSGITYAIPVRHVVRLLEKARRRN